MTGTIKRIKREGGFGFIRAASGVEYFFHRSGLSPKTCDWDDLNEGATVEFSEEESPKGPRATDVRVTAS